MFKGCIYRHWIVLDGVETSYIGLHKGVNPKKDRWGRNGKGYKPKKGKESTDFCKAILEYGWENFNHEIIGFVEAETKEQLALDLDEWEKYYIEKYDSFDNGFNSTTGGSGGAVMSEESIRKNSEATKQGMANMSDEEKKQWKEKQKQTWQNMSDEAKRQWKEKQKQTWQNMSDEEKKQRSEKQKQGFVNMSDEAKKQWREKMSEARKGDKNPMYGRTGEKSPMYGRTGEKHPNSKKVICLTTGQIFNCIKEAQKWLGKGNIYKCCNGESKHAGKHPLTGERLHWMYYSDYLEKQQNNKDDQNSSAEVA